MPAMNLISAERRLTKARMDDESYYSQRKKTSLDWGASYEIWVNYCVGLVWRARLCLHSRHNHSRDVRLPNDTTEHRARNETPLLYVWEHMLQQAQMSDCCKLFPGIELWMLLQSMADMFNVIYGCMIEAAVHWRQQSSSKHWDHFLSIISRTLASFTSVWCHFSPLVFCCFCRIHSPSWCFFRSEHSDPCSSLVFSI